MDRKSESMFPLTRTGTHFLAHGHVENSEPSPNLILWLPPFLLQLVDSGGCAVLTKHREDNASLPFHPGSIHQNCMNQHGCGSKLNQVKSTPTGDRRFWSMFLLSRVPCWDFPIFDPQPHHKNHVSVMLVVPNSLALAKSSLALAARTPFRTSKIGAKGTGVLFWRLLGKPQGNHRVPSFAGTHLRDKF